MSEPAWEAVRSRSPTCPCAPITRSLRCIMKVVDWLAHFAFGLFLGYSTTSLVGRWIEPQPHATFTFPGVVEGLCQFNSDGQSLVLRTGFLGYSGDDAWRLVNVDNGCQELIYYVDDDTGRRFVTVPNPVITPSGELVFVERREITSRVGVTNERLCRKAYFVTSWNKTASEWNETDSGVELPDDVIPSLARNCISPDGRWLVLPPCELRRDTERSMTEEGEPIPPPPSPLGRLLDLKHRESKDDEHLLKEIRFEYDVPIDVIKERYTRGRGMRWRPPVVKFSLDGELMAITISAKESPPQHDELIQVWDLRARELRHTLSDCQGHIESLRFEQGGKVLVASVVPIPAKGSSNSATTSKPNSKSLEMTFDASSGKLIPTDLRDYTTKSEADGWRIIQLDSARVSQLQQLEVLDPEGRKTCTLTDTNSSRFFPGTNLLDYGHTPSPSRFRWLWDRITKMVPALAKFDVGSNEFELNLMDRRNGSSVWKSQRNREFKYTFDPHAQTIPSVDRHPYAVSTDGKWLAEGTTDGYSTTFDFWELPQRRWPAWVAIGLGVLVAVVYWGLRRGPRSLVSNTLPPQPQPTVGDSMPAVGA